MKRLSIVVCLAGLALLSAGCLQTQTTSSGAVGVEREQTMLVSSAEVNRSADSAYRKTMQQAQQANRLNRDPALVQRVRGIATRLIATTGVFRPDAPGWRWEVNVITSNDLNAWCMPGGKNCSLYRDCRAPAADRCRAGGNYGARDRPCFA